MATLGQIEAGTHAVGYKWDNLTESDTDPPYVTAPFRSDASVAVWDDFGSGGTVTWEGSWQSADELIGGATPVWLPLSDISGSALEFTADGIGVRKENCVLMRPRVTAGTSVDVSARVLLTGNRG